MPISEYVARLRRCVGHDPLILVAAGACIRDEQGRILLLKRADEISSGSSRPAGLPLN